MRKNKISKKINISRFTAGTIFLALVAVAIFGFSKFALPVFAFDWPQDNVSQTSFFSFFGQKRGSTISNSLIFSEAEEAKTTDKGEVSIIITEHDDGFNWFESTLGTCVVTTHEDSLVSIYGNLDTDELNEKLLNNPKVEEGTYLSTTGNSAWVAGDSFLEFQVIDTKNANYVNPLIIMPRINREERLSLSGIILKNKFNKTYDLERQTNIPAGVYKVFKQRQNLAMPYKISILVNGAESEKITFDTIKQSENSLAIEGKKLYTHHELYPQEDLMLMGEIYLPHGKNTISLILTDFSGEERSRVTRVNSN